MPELTPGMIAVQSARQVFGHYIAVVKQALNRTASFEAGKAADQLLAAVQSTEDTGQSGGERLPHVHCRLVALSRLFVPYRGDSILIGGFTSACRLLWLCSQPLPWSTCWLRCSSGWPLPVLEEASVIRLKKLFLSMQTFCVQRTNGSVSCAGDWGAAVVAQALYTISNDVTRIQSLLPELSPQDR